jgi:HK97 gp10 family phage protein
MITFNPAELAALEKRLNEIADKVAKKALRSAARKAMKKVRAEARANAPEDTGLLDHNFGLLTKVRDGEVSAKVGIRGGAKRNDQTPFYFRFQEFGTRDIPAKPFLLPALESNAQEVLDTLVTELKAAVQNA